MIFFVSNNQFSVSHKNVQCLSKKLNKTEVVLNDLKPKIILFSEHWQSCDQLSEIRLRGYNLSSYFCRNERQHCSENLEVNWIKDFCADTIIQYCGLYIPTKKDG